jgi:hypothetical protein
MKPEIKTHGDIIKYWGDNVEPLTFREYLKSKKVQDFMNKKVVSCENEVEQLIKMHEALNFAISRFDFRDNDDMGHWIEFRKRIIDIRNRNGKHINHLEGK